MTKLTTAVLLCLALSACNTSRYPYNTPFADTSPAANRAPRGSAAFCENYGRQTAANRYESNRDSDGSFGSNAFEEQKAREEGRRAARRCLAGRTN